MTATVADDNPDGWPFELRPSPIQGQGVFATRPIRRGTRLIEYVGERVSGEEAEDTPRSLTYQLDLLRASGFGAVEVLHKNGPFAAFGAIKTE